MRALCAQHGLSDRIPRPIIPGEARAQNKRIAECLANTAYELELEEARPARVWAYRKAAWAVDDLEQGLERLFPTMGRRGLESIPGVSATIAGEIEAELRRHSAG